MIMAEGIDKSKKKNEEILAAITLANQDEEKTLAQIADEQSFSKKEEDTVTFTGKLGDTTLEREFVGLLLNQVRAISVYNFKYEDCFFANEEYLDLYKKVLFTDGEKYAPIPAKERFNFAKESPQLYQLKIDVRTEFENSKLDIEKVYIELSKLFQLRKVYLETPEKNIQAKIVEILDYELYDKMSVDDVKAAIQQILDTEKFKRSVLNKGLTDFLIDGEGTLNSGLSIPFKILSTVFKGIRRGETSSFAMPSNCGKSRYTTYLAAYIAIVHKKKVLIISNEMSEEKMKLCLITTIINSPDIQKIHGQRVRVSENQLLDLKFRPDDPKYVQVDKDGYVQRNDGESSRDFAERLKRVSTEFNRVINVTNWYNDNLYNSIHFINITDHTNDELKKVIMNYYYKENVGYVFYDTMKTDINNIGNGEELKKTATILSNIAQNFNIYIGTTLQLAETQTDPINLSVNDMAVSRTVKEVLDTLCLFKQIRSENFDEYQYSINETDEKAFDLQRFKNPDVRYYACVIDKNRAGPKPKLLFRLNLAYNYWEELGYLRLKNRPYEGGQ